MFNGSLLLLQNLIANVSESFTPEAKQRPLRWPGWAIGKTLSVSLQKLMLLMKLKIHLIRVEFL